MAMQTKIPKFETYLLNKIGPTATAITLFILEVLQIIIISSAIIIPIRYYLIQPFYVKGASMEPSFYDQEYLIIDELSFRFREPHRGETVVFRYPKDPDEYFIKRVVAIPGETVEVNNGTVKIYNDENPNGLLLDESYLEGERTFGKKRVTLSANEYYVLGDNRDESLDSRSFGPIKEEHLIGRVWVRGLPLNRIQTFDLPEYNL